METARESDRQSPEEAVATSQLVSEAVHSSPQVCDTQTDAQMPAPSADGEARLSNGEDASATSVLSNLPTITLSMPSPPPLYDQLFPPQAPTERTPVIQASPEATLPAGDQRPQESPQAHHPTPGTPPQCPTPTATPVNLPPVQIVPRPQGDIDEIFEAIETNNFDSPIFGEAGAVYHDKLTRRVMPRTPMFQHYNIIPEVPQPRPVAAPNDRLQTPDTPTPKPKPKRKPRKRKRDETPQETVIKEEDGVKEEPVEKKQKGVKIEDAA
ncbi:hypothetical protein J4E85_008115 [Alternaria conjuncta]|uniref:uncharacterized protein n=1 Tax=Alternaria conjuncta TaxID=181017 RepID=UPI00221FDFA0|nr:uncharacterized protein J4E85_008115 [Alternaria conjuncta]KAI4923957.1 hypothetical protein J4E85_008115 [Alternaria conjuncta]